MTMAAAEATKGPAAEAGETTERCGPGVLEQRAGGFPGITGR